MEFHDRRTGQHLEIHGGGYFAKPKPKLAPGQGRVSSEPVDTRPTTPPPARPDPLSVKHLNAPTSAAARKPDPFGKRGQGHGAP